MQIHDQPTLKAEARNLNFYYGEAKALKGINMPIYDKKVTALIGPSGCGKSTYLRSFNRMHDLYPGNRYEGEIRFFPDNTNLLAPKSIRSKCACASAWSSRSRIPSPSRSFRERRLRPACARRKQQARTRRQGRTRLEGRGDLGRSQGPPAGARLQPLRRPAAAPVHRPRPGDRPELLLFDEPTSALDPIATGAIEELVHELKKRVTILIVTHNMQQAARVSDYTAYMYLGEMIEFGKTDEIFIKPQDKRTEDYITGRMG
jgi:phosphate transport system ATP-binding protein